MRWPVLVALSTLSVVSGCGGGKGSSAPDSRLSASVTKGSALLLHDPTTDVTIASDNQLWQSNGLVFLGYGDPSRPLSPAVTPSLGIMCETTATMGVGVFTATVPVGQYDPNELLGYIQSDGEWQSLQTEVSPDQHHVLVSLPLPIESNRAGGNLPKINVGWVPFNSTPTENTVGVAHLYGTGAPAQLPGSGRILIVNHGTAVGLDNIKSLAKRLYDSDLYDSVYGGLYPWPTKVKDNGAALAALLNALPDGQKVDIVAHSMGGLISRWAIEQKGAYAHVDNLVMLGTPCKGTLAAVDLRIQQGYQNEHLNDTGNKAEDWSHLDSFLKADSTKDMYPGSPLVNALNLGTPLLVRTNYLALGGTKDNWEHLIGKQLHNQYYPGQKFDGLVPLSSLHGVNYSNITSGITVLKEVPLNHSELVTKPEVSDAIVDFIIAMRNMHGPQMKIDIDNNGKAKNDGWEWRITLTNGLSFNTNMIVDELIMVTFNDLAAWDASHWYDPNTPSGQYFPTTPTLWGVVLRPNQPVSVAIHTDFDPQRHSYADTAPENRAKTVLVVAKGHWTTGQYFDVAQMVTLLDANGNPPHKKLTIRSAKIEAKTTRAAPTPLQRRSH